MAGNSSLRAVRSAALAAGVFYLITFVAGIPPSFLYEPVLSNPDYVLSGGADTQVALGAFLDVVNALTGIGTAVALSSVLKWQQQSFALGFVTTRTVEAAFIMEDALTSNTDRPIQDWTDDELLEQYRRPTGDATGAVDTGSENQWDKTLEEILRRDLTLPEDSTLGRDAWSGDSDEGNGIPDPSSGATPPM